MKKIFCTVLSLSLLFSFAYAKSPTYTTYLNLEKPDINDEYDIGVPNSNMGIIDTALGTQHETTGEHKTITFKVDNTSDVGSSSLRPRDVYAGRNLTDGTNTATVANIKDAVEKKHAPNTDTKLGTTSNGIVKTTNSDGTVAIATSGTDYAPMSSGIIPGQYFHLKFTIVDPASVYGKSATICIWNKTDSAIHIKNIKFRCNADPTTEVTGDIKYADDLIGLANPTLIAAIDTTAGSFSSGAINVAVASGKCIYLSYDTTPDVNTTQHAVDITFTYD